MLAKIYGQNEAVQSVVEAVQLSSAGLTDDNKPMASLLFVGPTGVGKTEIARSLADELGVKLVRFDMSEYEEKHAVAKLIGAPAGYVGYEEGGLLTEQIRCKKARPMIEEEYQAHIDDQKLDFMAQGMSEAEAEEAAVREMGDPVEAGVQLDRIHRPKMDMRLIAMIVMLGISGVAIQVFLERTAILCGAGDYLAASYDPAGLRFILWTAAGSILMLGVCFVDYTLLGKYALRIWAAMMMMMAVYRVFGRTVNGMYPKQGLFYCVLVPVFAGVVFHFRGAGKQGMMKCILILVLSTVLPLVLNSSVYMILFYMTGGCILILAVHKRWFGKEKKRQYILMAGTTVLLPVGILLSITRNQNVVKAG